jgi:hypothetical protein
VKACKKNDVVCKSCERDDEVINKTVRKWVKSVLLYLYKKMEAAAEADLPRFANNPKNLGN